MIRLRRFVRWGAALLVTLLVASAAVGHARFRARSDRVYAATRPIPHIPRDAATLARGEHLAKTLAGCAECHGQDFGGRVVDDSAILRFVAPNLTPGQGSAVRDYRDADWFRAIAHGLDPNGHSLIVMPSREFSNFGDGDLAALIAYFEQLPPVDRSLDRTEVHAFRHRRRRAHWRVGLQCRRD